MSDSCKHLFISIVNLSKIEKFFFKRVSTYAIMIRRFPIWYVFERCSVWINLYFRLRSFFESFSIPMSMIHSDFLLFSLRSHILLQYCFVFLSSVCWFVFVHSPLLVGRIFFRWFWMSGIVSIVLSYLYVCLVFLLSSVASGIFPRGVLSILLVAFLLLFVRTFFIVLSLWHVIINFCASSWISHPRFVFLVLFFKRTLILSQINFAPAYISSFSSVMLFVEICVNNSFFFF